MSDSTILSITGANTGLRLEVVKSPCRLQNKYRIILGSRTVSNGESAVNTVKQEYPDATSTFEVVQADLSSDESLQNAVDSITTKHSRLDVLINNAGADFGAELGSGGYGNPRSVERILGHQCAWNTGAHDVDGAAVVEIA